MRTMTAEDFCARCLELLDEIYVTGEIIIITRDGIAIVQIVPVKKNPVKKRTSKIKK